MFTNPKLTDGTIPVTGFHEVSPGIYRGAHPSREVLKAMRDGGMRTIVSLQAMPWDTIWMRRDVESLGMTFINHAIPGLYIPDAAVREAVRVLGDPANHPVYVHCKLGNDRTGLVVALHRVLNEKWHPADAHAEMLRHKFHRVLWYFEKHFVKRSGWAAERKREREARHEMAAAAATPLPLQRRSSEDARASGLVLFACFR